jgi:hypothetical protein
MHAMSSDAKPTVLQFSEQELSQSPLVLSDLNAIIAHGELLNILVEEEVGVLINRMRTAKRNFTLGTQNSSV